MLWFTFIYIICWLKSCAIVRSQCIQWRPKTNFKVNVHKTTKVLEASSLQNLKALTLQWMITIIQNRSHLSLKLSHMGGLKLWISESVLGKVSRRGLSLFSRLRRYHYSNGLFHFFSYFFFYNFTFLKNKISWTFEGSSTPFWDLSIYNLGVWGSVAFSKVTSEACIAPG